MLSRFFNWLAGWNRRMNDEDVKVREDRRLNDALTGLRKMDRRRAKYEQPEE